MPVAVSCVHPGGIKTAIARNARVADGEDQAALAEFFDRKLAKTGARARRPRSSSTACWPTRPKIVVGADAKFLDLLVRGARLRATRTWSQRDQASPAARSRLVPQADSEHRASDEAGRAVAVLAGRRRHVAIGPAAGPGRPAADPLAAPLAGADGRDRCPSRPAPSSAGAPWAAGRGCGSRSARPSGRARSCTCTAGRTRSARRAATGRWPRYLARPPAPWSTCPTTGWRRSTRTRPRSRMRVAACAAGGCRARAIRDQRGLGRRWAGRGDRPPAGRRRRPCPRPRSALISPWVDPRAGADRPQAGPGGAGEAGDGPAPRTTSAAATRTDAGFAPGRGDLAGLPPTLVQIGRPRGAVRPGQPSSPATCGRPGSTSTLTELPRLWHVGHVVAGVLVEAEEAVAELGRFLRTRMRRSAARERSDAVSA